MKKFLIIGIIFTILFAGCIDMSLEQTLSRDGSSSITSIIDLSNYLSYMEEYESLDEFDEKSVCESYEEAGIDCNYKDGVITLFWETTPEKEGYSFEVINEIPNTIYVFQINKVPSPRSDEDYLDMGDEEIYFDSPKAREMASSFRMVFSSFTYIIDMPGEIYEVENGKIIDGKAHFDVIELLSKGESIEVRSKESNFLYVIILLGLIILVIGVLAYFFLNKK